MNRIAQLTQHRKMTMQLARMYRAQAASPSANAEEHEEGVEGMYRNVSLARSISRTIRCLKKGGR